MSSGDFVSTSEKQHNHGYTSMSPMMIGNHSEVPQEAMPNPFQIVLTSCTVTNFSKDAEDNPFPVLERGQIPPVNMNGTGTEAGESIAFNYKQYYVKDLFIISWLCEIFWHLNKLKWRVSYMYLILCPNHFNLPRLTTSATLCIPKRLSNPHFPSFCDTPHIGGIDSCLHNCDWFACCSL